MASVIPGFPNIPGLPQPPVPPLQRVQAPDAGTKPVPQAGTGAWGVYDSNNNPVAVWDTVDAVAFELETRIMGYPVEGGSFATYNKVVQPFRAPVRLVCGGDEATRQRFLDAIDAACRSLDLYSVVVPERTYLNANITRYAFRREREDGAYLLKVDLYLEEVRIAQVGFTSTTQSPASASPQPVGLVQPQAPTQAQQSALSKLTDYIRSLVSP